jgi:RimJ/RimL family protein N-acetyltransferase
MLIEADDAAFSALVVLEAPAGLRLAEKEWESVEILTMLWRLAQGIQSRFTPAAWMIVEDGELVGLCSLKNAPGTDRRVEIGYGVAPSRRGRGVARRAIGEVLAWAQNDGRVAVVTADTGVDNIASQRVLERNGFVRVGTRVDDEDGELICWEISVER